MAFPLLLVGGGAAALLFLAGKKKPAGPASPSSPGAVASPVNPATGQPVPIAERMAVVLASGNAAAIRFEAGRLRQEGYPAQASELEREAGKLEAQAAAAQQAAGAAAAHAAAPPAAAPVVAPLPPGAVTSPGFVPPPAQAAPPPVVIQTPAGPISVPVPVLPPLPPVVVQTPAGPVTLPPIAVPQPPVVVQTPAGPVTLPAGPPMTAVLLPLPSLAPNELLTRTNPGQTVSPKTQLWQNKLVSLGLMKPADAIGQFGPTTEAATKQFQLLANAWLKSHPMQYQGKSTSKIDVDGKVGPQTLTAATLAHPPTGTGPTAAYFGALQAPAYPQPASPLPGIVPPMAPKDIEPSMALAARVAANLFSTADGQEDRNLVQLFQASRGLKASGYYGPETAWGLAAFGIVPPKPRYWVRTGTTKAKRNYKKALLEQAAKDPQRAEEWRAAANV